MPLVFRMESDGRHSGHVDHLCLRINSVWQLRIFVIEYDQIIFKMSRYPDKGSSLPIHRQFLRRHSGRRLTTQPIAGGCAPRMITGGVGQWSVWSSKRDFLNKRYSLSVISEGSVRGYFTSVAPFSSSKVGSFQLLIKLHGFEFIIIIAGNQKFPNIQAQVTFGYITVDQFLITPV